MSRSTVPVSPRLHLRDHRLRAPSPASVLREAFVVPDLVKSVVQLPRLALEPRGQNEPVLVLPGFGASDRATRWIRRYLGSRGYRTRGWTLGRNGGNVPELIPRVIERVAALAEETGQPVRLVGWSLGGNLAREAARERPELVDRVITLGTPVVGGPRYTVVGNVYRRRGYDLSEIEAYVAERSQMPIEVPITAVYSRRDGIVAWRACIDHLSPDVELIEVSCSHTGFLVSGEVFRLLARRLVAV